jgi:hypothetical protein
MAVGMAITNGAPAPLDGYIYVIKYKGKDDNDYTQTGNYHVAEIILL